jgi:hypothetical protein
VLPKLERGLTYRLKMERDEGSTGSIRQLGIQALDHPGESPVPDQNLVRWGRSRALSKQPDQQAALPAATADGEIPRRKVYIAQHFASKWFR